MSPSSPPSLRRTIAAITATCALAAVVSVGAGPQASVDAAAGSVSGVVFQDFNSNGVMDTTLQLGRAVDVGVAGVSVRLVDSTGAVVGSGTTDASGAFSVAVAAAASLDVRVEFEVDQSVPALAGLVPSFATSTGASNSTYGGVVQFARLGDTGVNLAVNRPGEYCQNNPNLAVSRQCMNSQTAPSLWVTRYDGGPYKSGNGYTNLYTDWSSTSAGRVDTTGSIHGLAWDRRSGRVLSAAYVRSFTRLYENPLGTPRPAAVFSTTPSDTSTAPGVGGATSFLVDLETLLPGDQFSNTTPPPTGVANAGFTGYIPSNADRNLPLGPDSDIHASYDGVYEEVGKAGIGDMDIDDHGDLYVVSLYSRELYRVPLPGDGSVPTSMSSVGSIVQGVACNRGDARPFGVTHWRGDLYMGVVCDGSQDFSIAAPNSDTDERNVTYSIVRYSPTTSTWGTFLGPFPLYSSTVGGNFKGSPIAWYLDNSGGVNHNTWRWNPWTDQFSLSWRTNGSSAWGPVYPHPMPSDLQFDRDGSVIVSLRDRTGDRMTQFVTGSFYPDGSPRDQTGEISAGDMYRICRTGNGYTPQDYVWEGGTGCPQNFDNFNFNNGGVAREYYRDDYGYSNQFHGDQSAGMLAYVPGFREVINTAMDPNLGWNGSAWDLSGNTFSSGGLSYYLNTTGDRQTAVNPGGGVILFGSPLSSLGMSDGSFGKIAGMGDVEVLCDVAPVQVGDRVWFDVDGDGVQGAGEGAVVGVRVRLVDADGVEVASVVTDTNGEFRFSSVSAVGSVVASGLGSASGWRLVIDDPAVFGSGGVLAGWGVTEGFVGSGSGVDSDAVVVGGFPSVAVPVMVPGVNVLSLDIGFVPLVAVGDRVWFDADSDGVQGSGEVSLAGVRVELLDAAGDPAVDGFGVPVPAQVTGADGLYLFDGLVPGEYRVRFTAPDGWVPTVEGAGVSGSDSDADRVSGVTPVFTLVAGVAGDMVVDSDPLTLASFVDVSIDAGFVPVVSVGDFVWDDADGDGVFDVGEVPLAGVVLELTDLGGGPVVDVFGVPVGSQVSGVDGSYGFVNLPPGSYRVVASTPVGWVATRPVVDVSAPLLTAGAVDPTLDFGFRRAPEPDPTTTTTTTPSDSSSSTTVLVDPCVGLRSGVCVEPGGASLPGVVEGVVSVDGGPVSGAVVVVAGGVPVVTGGDGGFVVSGVVSGRVPVVVTPPPGVDPGVVVVTVSGDACDPCVVEVLAPTLPTTGGPDESRMSVLVLLLSLGGFIAMSARRRTHP